jgi:hypothetical protein
MHQNVDIEIDDLNGALEEAFLAVLPAKEKIKDVTCSIKGEKKKFNVSSDSSRQESDRYYWSWSPKHISNPLTTRRPFEVQISDLINVRNSGHSSTPVGITLQHMCKRSLVDLADLTASSCDNGKHSTQSSPITDFSDAIKDQSLSFEQDMSIIDNEPNQNSIFSATSEYIITGNELVNQTITVSTHGMHILSRHTIIEDTKRYERNNLLFAVGFVLRRKDNPRPFWPVLSNLSSTFRDMEVESEFLTNESSRPRVQIALEDMLASLNSRQGRCHLPLYDANLLTLRLFRTPTLLALPVPDHAVPILLMPEKLLQAYDWDLTINWIVPHIDGVKHVAQIASSTEVDMDMVRACLQVLRHHGVLAQTDIFRYHNVYERVGPSSLGFGDDREEKNKIIDEAFWFSVRSKYVCCMAPQTYLGASTPKFNARLPFCSMARRLQAHMSLHSTCLSASFLSPAIRWADWRQHKDSDNIACLQPPSQSCQMENFSVKVDTADDNHSKKNQSKQIKSMKQALVQIYSLINRGETFGEMLKRKLVTQINDVSESLTDEEFGNDNSKIDWHLAFNYFDHRRLVTFGVVRGFLRRVHQFPLALEIKVKNAKAKANVNLWKKTIDSCDGSSNYLGDDSSTDLSKSSPYCASPVLQGIIVHKSFVKRSEALSNKITQEDLHLRSKSRLLKRIVLAMDGTRCDDELSCMFEHPIEKLVNMVEITGRWRVSSVFSSTE